MYKIRQFVMIHVNALFSADRQNSFLLIANFFSGSSPYTL